MKTDDFELTLPGEVVPCRFFIPEETDKTYCVLWLQGWTSSMDSHIDGVKRMVEATSLPFMTLDYAGHGKHKTSLEDSTREQQHLEVVAVFDEIKRRGYEKVIVIGGSFGGYMAALLCGVRPVYTAVLRVPAMYPDEEFNTKYKETAKWKNPDLDQKDKAQDTYITNNAALTAIKNFSGYTYVIEHELDEQVPSIMPKTYYANSKYGNYLIVPRTKHSPKLMPNPQPHFDYIEHWLVSIVNAIKLQDKIPG